LMWSEVNFAFNIHCPSNKIACCFQARLLTKTKSLNEGFDSIVSIQNPEKISNENNGKLIHLVGYLQVGEPLTEFDYGVSITAVKLKRRVQTYQWVEEKTLRYLKTSNP
jgi:hypothetical protein